MVTFQMCLMMVFIWSCICVHLITLRTRCIRVAPEFLEPLLEMENRVVIISNLAFHLFKRKSSECCLQKCFFLKKKQLKIKPPLSHHLKGKHKNYTNLMSLVLKCMLQEFPSSSCESGVCLLPMRQHTFRSVPKRNLIIITLWNLMSANPIFLT